jgi:hypothetical protein
MGAVDSWLHTGNKILDHTGCFGISDCMCRGVWFEFYILNSIFDQKYKDCYILTI